MYSKIRVVHIVNNSYFITLPLVPLKSFVEIQQTIIYAPTTPETCSFSVFMPCQYSNMEFELRVLGGVTTNRRLVRNQ